MFTCLLLTRWCAEVLLWEITGAPEMPSVCIKGPLRSCVMRHPDWWLMRPGRRVVGETATKGWRSGGVQPWRCHLWLLSSPGCCKCLGRGRPPVRGLPDTIEPVPPVFPGLQVLMLGMPSRMGMLVWRSEALTPVWTCIRPLMRPL